MSHRFSCVALAADMGGVILMPHDHVVPGAMTALRRLVTERFGSRVHLISCCPEPKRARRLAALHACGFFETTGISPDHVHFGDTPGDKAEICAKLGITHFVENDLGVLGYMRTVPNLFYFETERPTDLKIRALLRFVNDPTDPSMSDPRRPIRLIRAWNDELVQCLSARGTIFRHIPGFHVQPMPL